MSIKAKDSLIAEVEEDKIAMEPVRASDALKRLTTIADRYLGGPKDVDAVKLVEESLEREAGLH